MDSLRESSLCDRRTVDTGRGAISLARKAVAAGAIVISATSVYTIGKADTMPDMHNTFNIPLTLYNERTNQPILERELAVAGHDAVIAITQKLQSAESNVQLIDKTTTGAEFRSTESVADSIEGSRVRVYIEPDSDTINFKAERFIRYGDVLSATNRVSIEFTAPNSSFVQENMNLNDFMVAALNSSIKSLKVRSAEYGMDIEAASEGGSLVVRDRGVTLEGDEYLSAIAQITTASREITEKIFTE